MRILFNIDVKEAAFQALLDVLVHRQRLHLPGAI